MVERVISSYNLIFHDDNYETKNRHIKKAIKNKIKLQHDIYYQFNILRNYITVPNKKEIIDVYKKNIGKAERWNLNSMIPRKTSDIRIMTWNIRYFTNIDNEKTINQIIETIKKIKPDILCLQEITFGNNKYYSDENPSINKYLDDYNILSMCNVVPSWYSEVYGNAIFIRKDYYERIIFPNKTVMGHLCEPGIGKCFHDQYTRTYEFPNMTKDTAGKESRCFIKISLGTIDLFCTHLEAYDTEIRKKQLDEINSHILRPSIIVGDFNIIDRYIYKVMPDNIDKINTELEILAKNNNIPDDIEDSEYYYIINDLKWYDLWQIMRANNIEELIELDKKDDLIKHLDRIKEILLTPLVKPNVTSWTNTVVDYMFFKNPGSNELIDCQKMFVHFNTFSDHLPVIADINILKGTEHIQNIDKSRAEYPTTSTGLFKNYYNGQPLIAYDWINFMDKKIGKKYNFTDPYVTGNYDLQLGNEGVYITETIDDAWRYAKIFQKRQYMNREIMKDNRYGLKESVGLLFEFTLKNNDFKEIVIDKTKFDPKMDKEFDVILDIKSTRKILKFTNRQYDDDKKIHDLVDFESVFIIVSDNFETPVQKLFENLKYMELFQLNDNVMTTFINSLIYINYLSSGKTNLEEYKNNNIYFNIDKLIENQDNINVSTNVTSSGVKYLFNITTLLKNTSMRGGSIHSYEHIAKKYKMKYLAAKLVQNQKLKNGYLE